MLSVAGRRAVAAAVVLVLIAPWAPVAGGEAPGPAAGTIGFDLTGLDAAGLYGPPDGLRALDYEFCIPDRAHAIAAVRAIDPSVRMFRAPGRIGCRAGRLLCIGNTHQSGYRGVLAALVRLPFVARIEQTHFE